MFGVYGSVPVTPTYTPTKKKSTGGGGSSTVMPGSWFAKKEAEEAVPEEAPLSQEIVGANAPPVPAAGQMEKAPETTPSAEEKYNIGEFAAKNWRMIFVVLLVAVAVIIFAAKTRSKKKRHPEIKF